MKTGEHWQKIGLHAHHGILVPLFSLKTKSNAGTGEFLDLIPLIDWCKKIGFDTIQLLPLNDTGSDLSPYNPISSCALDPAYLHLPEYKEKGTKRNEIKNKKLKLLWEEYKKNPVDTSEFLKQNPWLESYGRFMGDLSFHTFVQYRCFSQFRRVKEYATKQKVFLKGDLPHLISPKSADVWALPHLFRTDLVAGAPPDKYNALGQKWGFPLYDWDTMRKNHFSWWKQRFDTIESLYHIYRIDHVVGFFRIWGIPPDHPATEGHFVPPDRPLWAPLGREILEMMIGSSSLLPMAEDLGTIPHEVYPILKELGVCGVKVLRWQPNIPYQNYEPFSMTTVSTPDMETLRELDPTLSIEQRFKILQEAHSTSSYFHINQLQEYLSLFPELSWPDPHQDRINIPGTISDSNWSYQFRPTLEEMISHEPLASAMKSLIR